MDKTLHAMDWILGMAPKIAAIAATYAAYAAWRAQRALSLSVRSSKGRSQFFTKSVLSIGYWCKAKFSRTFSSPSAFRDSFVGFGSKTVAPSVICTTKLSHT